VLFNNADGNYEASYKPNVLLYADIEADQPNIHWIPPAIYKSSCTIDVRYFPFDEQLCEMRFGSWTFDAQQVRIQREKPMVNLEDYLPSGTWDVISAPGVETYSKETNRMELVYHFRIRRKTLFYTVNLIIPTVLISFLSIFVFYLPTDEGEKMTLCISILLALVVFLLLVSKILPPTSMVIPLISKYLIFTLMMNIVTILNTVIIINWNYRTPRTHNMPKWVKIIFIAFLPKVLFMQRPEQPEKDAHGESDTASHLSESGSVCSGGQLNAKNGGELVVNNDDEVSPARHRLVYGDDGGELVSPNSSDLVGRSCHKATGAGRQRAFKKNFSLELADNLNAETAENMNNNTNNSAYNNNANHQVGFRRVNNKQKIINLNNRASQASSFNLNVDTNLDFGAISCQNSSLQREKQSKLVKFLPRFYRLKKSRYFNCIWLAP
jgi:hypothetical protein